MSFYRVKLNFYIVVGLVIISTLTINACNEAANPIESIDQISKATSSSSVATTKVIVPSSTSAATATPLPLLTPTPTVPPTSTSTPMSLPTATSTPSPLCKTPTEDYTHVIINDQTINRRTELMLDWAKEIYKGPGDLKRIAQGSYTDELDASFGTHAGGGAVDISIRNPAKLEERLFGEVDAMIFALRHAGFAAWYRAEDSVYPGSVPHIHAIAIGDKELSPAAEAQLTGDSGYFRELDGLPPEYGGPNPDPHGTPVICPWMNELGYFDLRATTTPQPK